MITDTRSWGQRLVNRGRRREPGRGAAGLVTRAEVCELALANCKFARSGRDPLSEKRRAEGVPTFAQAAATRCGRQQVVRERSEQPYGMLRPKNLTCLW